jgi:hypothetical protein
MADEPSTAAEAALDVAEGSSKLQKAAAIATTVLRHKELLVAAMEALRDKQVLTEEQEVKVMAAYEQGSNAAKSAIHDLLQKLQQANLGKVLVDLSKEIEGQGPAVTPEMIRGVAQPYIAAAKEALAGEAKPYIERAKQRLIELKAIEEPTLARLEALGQNFRMAGKEVATGLKGVGREAADELVKRGKRIWMSPETEELEREFFDWTLRTLPKAEQTLVRTLIGTGLLLLLAGVLVAAREVAFMKQIAIFLSIFLLILLGLAFLNWGIKISEAIKGHKGEIENLARMKPAERRVFLTQKWAKRAQDEGLITSNEAQTVIMQTIRAVPEDDAEAADSRPRAPEAPLTRRA